MSAPTNNELIQEVVKANKVRKYLNEVHANTSDELQDKFSFGPWLDFPKHLPPKEGQYPVRHSDNSIGVAFYQFDEHSESCEWSSPDVRQFCIDRELHHERN